MSGETQFNMGAYRFSTGVAAASQASRGSICPLIGGNCLIAKNEFAVAA